MFRAHLSLFALEARENPSGPAPIDPFLPPGPAPDPNDPALTQPPPTTPTPTDPTVLATQIVDASTTLATTTIAPTTPDPNTNNTIYNVPLLP